MDSSNIACGIHIGQSYCLFCQPCEVVVCPLCISETHNGHTMIELAEGYNLAVKKLKTLKSKIDQKLVHNDKLLSELTNIKSSVDSKYESEEKKILSRKKTLEDEVGEHTKKRLKDLDLIREIQVESVKDGEDISEKIQEDLYLKETTSRQASKSDSASEVFRIYSEIKTREQVNNHPVNTISKKLPTFVPGKEKIQDFYLGAFKEADVFKVINQYKTALPFIQNLVCCEDGAILIGHYFSHRLHKLKLTNESLFQMSIIEINSFNMAFLPSGDLLLSTKESSLKILSCSTRKVEPTKYSVSPLITIAVHVTGDQRILVGAREDQPKPFPVNGPRLLIVLNIDGKKEKAYHIDNKGKPIFTLPYRITTDKENNIYVIDIQDVDRTGRIVALDKSSGVRWIYSGHPDINKEQIFRPKDLVVTKSNNIILADGTNHHLHIVNTSGHCIHYLSTKDQLGIELPFCLDIDNTDTLYIGCYTYQDEPEKENIYTVQISGF
ncbi:unnamed protein product [Mytilus edulis]|uniref:B box-type domain-containing protein n=1 Tax=Mytilus edulis TaxID=6550 RepID=A0A8S3UYU7_MYTED|nr:unnamed protein product [Mytilus edulis]